MGLISLIGFIPRQQELGCALLLGRPGILVASVCADDRVFSNLVLATHIQYSVHSQHCLAVTELKEHNQLHDLDWITDIRGKLQFLGNS